MKPSRIGFMVTLTACMNEDIKNDETSTDALASATVLSDEAINWSDCILGRDGGYSAGHDANDDGRPDYSLWTFGDTFLRDRAGCRDPTDPDPALVTHTVALTTDLDGSDGICLSAAGCPGWEHPAGGVPSEFIPLSAGERWINAANGCDDPVPPDSAPCFFLWTAPVVSDSARDRALFWFISAQRSKTQAGDLTAYRTWRTGLAVWNQNTGAVTRPASRSTNPIAGWDQWSLFDKDAEGMYEGGLVRSVNGVPHLYATKNSPGTPWPRCRMARAPLASATSRSAWQFFAGTGTNGAIWSDDYRDAVPLPQNGSPEGLDCFPPQRTISYNDYLGRYLLIHGFGGDDTHGATAWYSTAPKPWGPWSASQPLFTTLPLPPEACTIVIVDEVKVKRCSPIYNIQEHPELASEGGRRIFVSYHWPTGGFDGGVRGVNLRLP